MGASLTNGKILEAFVFDKSDDSKIFRRFTERLREYVKARSLRLLNEPSKLKYHNGCLVATDSNTAWRISKTSGPKRFSQQVLDHVLHRDYYKIETDQNDLLCVYYCGIEKRFFLHGYFD